MGKKRSNAGGFFFLVLNNCLISCFLQTVKENQESQKIKMYFLETGWAFAKSVEYPVFGDHLLNALHWMLI